MCKWHCTFDTHSYPHNATHKKDNSDIYAKYCNRPGFYIKLKVLVSGKYGKLLKQVKKLKLFYKFDPFEYKQANTTKLFNITRLMYIITHMCDFTDYGIADKQKITKKLINEDDEVWENEPELEKIDSEEEKPKEGYIPLTQ